MGAAKDTIKHIGRVQQLLQHITRELDKRAEDHDASKLTIPEAKMFDIYTERLRGMTYGSDEYKKCLAEMKPALDHHYATNRHHPEHFEMGVQEMTIIDLVEMLADWKAATERHADGSMKKSLEHNADRFLIPFTLMRLLQNTVEAMGWGDE